MKKLKTMPAKWIRILLPSVFIVGWLALAGIGGPYFGKISDVSSTDLNTFLPNSAESTKVNDELTKFRDTKIIPLIVIYSHEDKHLTDSDLVSINETSSKLAKVEGVSGKISPPITSDDNKAIFTVLPITSDGDFKQIFSAIKTELGNAHLSIPYSLTGPASFARDLQSAFAGIDGTLLLVALGVVFFILLIVYRSPILPFLVLFTSMAALATAILLVYYLAKSDIVQLNGQVQGILFILVIGAATDYSLLYIARYREELTNYKTAWDATRAALKSSFEPILAAGGTVTIGLLCLLFSDLGSNKALGPVGGIGIILSVISALTLLPALLLGFGRTVFWPRKPKYVQSKDHHDYERNHPLWVKVGAIVRRYPRKIWTGSSIVLLIACFGVLQLKAVGVPQSDLILGKSEARDGQKILDAHFPAGSGSPALITVPHDKRDAVLRLVDANEGVASVSIAATGVDGGQAPVGKAQTSLKEKIVNEIVEKQSGQPISPTSARIIAEQTYPFKNAKDKIVDGRILFQVTLADATDSLAARETIVELREQLKAIDNSILVGGTTAAQYDTNEAALRDEKVIIPLILVAITIILMLLLRAIIAPLVLLVTTVLSFGATLGISAFLFNHVWHFPGADPSVVIFGFVFLVALGIDYNIFLMTRVREETIKSGVSKGTIKGLVITGGVITSAGVVLAATFAALGVIPILFLVQLAFIVAFGVLLDTLIVRSLLVPALTLEVGRYMWWPSKLSKRLTPQD